MNNSTFRTLEELRDQLISAKQKSDENSHQYHNDLNKTIDDCINKVVWMLEYNERMIGD